MVKVKICGLWRPADIVAANEAKPDYIGFVFAESRRKVTPEQALALREKLSPGIISVGVFVDEDIGVIVGMIKAGIIDAVQLHGSEGEAYIRELKALTDRPVIKAVAILREGDAQAWQGSAADYLLFDSTGGGTGRSFDWRLIGEVGKPFFLAGGLDTDNLNAALGAALGVALGTALGAALGDANAVDGRWRSSKDQSATWLHAIDVSSGVETQGYKDPAKIRDFVEKARAYDY